MGYSPGIYDGISNADYHADPALGSTSLKTLATRTPAHYQHNLKHPKQSAAFDLGTAAHSLILEGDESGVVVIDVADKRGAKWTEPANKAEAAGKIALTSKEWAQVSGMRDAVMAHPLARAALEGGEPERSVFWDHETGTPLKCRPDMLHRGGKLGNLIVDLKTVQSASPGEFARSAATFGYHIQQAHYQAGLKAAMGEEFDFIFVLIEKSAPYLPAVIQLDAEDVARGAELAERSIRIFNECTKTGRWPGYESSAPIELPRWSRFQEEEILDAHAHY